MKYILVIALLGSLTACNNTKDSDHNGIDSSLIPAYVGIAPPANITYTILAQHPHDTSAYTQGLQVYNGKLYEGTGDFETSSLRITDWKDRKSVV